MVRRVSPTVPAVVVPTGMYPLVRTRVHRLIRPGTVHKLQYD